ncbi:hypothetical Protein YC6258_03502 [Gynuella sunshinyii YC6258]|uniref:DUF2589 domain-containing protein n=2 Tax=Gynuella sunshinyii TaxID=1445505 RepID=A0A0C5VQ19_9GAMM|nr:hypothetical Protein YC6258_03502 [Gynuella sunshinyii YC6258]
MANDKSRLTLSQAVLAPINSILQAQVHASRSFLNLIFQMGFGHKAIDDSGNVTDQSENTDTMYRFDYIQEKYDSQGNLKKYKVSIPVLAALPLNPLVIEEAEVQFSMTLANEYRSQKQFSESGQKAKATKVDEKYRETNRPWYVVDNPVDLLGSIGDESTNGAKIDIRLKVGKGDLPAELKKFIATASDFGMATDVGIDK